MGIWKTNNRTSVAAEPANFEFTSLDQASPSTAEANAAAAQIIEDAHAEAEAIRQQAFEQGRTEAELQLRIEAEARQQIAAPILAKVAHAIEQLQTAACERAESSVIPIAVAIARKVLAKELNNDPNPSPELVKESLELVAGVEAFQVAVPPDAVATVQQAIEQIVCKGADRRAIQVTVDNTLQPGDMVLRSEFGVIDQRSETRLNNILSELESA